MSHVEDEHVIVRIRGPNRGHNGSSYSCLVYGKIQPSSILSTVEPNARITWLENDMKLITGQILRDETAGFVMDGRIIAIEFDEPTPSVEVDHAYVDPDKLPTVTEYMGHGPDQEPVTDPFPNVGELGETLYDPLYPTTYTLEIEAYDLDEAGAYCFDVNGTIVEYSNDSQVSESGERVFGCLDPGESITITIRGKITRIDTADGIDFTVSANDETSDDEQSWVDRLRSCYSFIKTVKPKH